MTIRTLLRVSAVALVVCLSAPVAHAVNEPILQKYPDAIKQATVLAVPSLKGGLLGTNAAVKELGTALQAAEAARTAANLHDTSFNFPNEMLASWPNETTVRTNVTRVVKDWGRARTALLGAMDNAITKADAAKVALAKSADAVAALTTVAADARAYKTALEAVTVEWVTDYKIEKGISAWEVLSPAGQVARVKGLLGRCRTTLPTATTMVSWSRFRGEQIRGVGAVIKSIKRLPAPLLARWTVVGADLWQPTAVTEFAAKGAELLTLITETETALDQ